MTLNDVRDALLTVGVPVFHYTAFEQSNEYIVWAEDNQADSVWADGLMQEQSIEGTIDYFTKTENDPNVQKIQDALNDGSISWRLNSVQYEDDTKYIHYEWIFQVSGW
jgi:hypothetical protein